MRTALSWAALGLALGAPLLAAAVSPLLEWRSAIYILAGFAGILAMGLLLVQPLLAGGDLPGLAPLRARRVHAGVGALLAALVAVHVGALWLTSPPDVVDALLLASPTPFSLWGVIGMWAVLATALLATLWRRMRLRPMTWRRLHVALAALIAGCTIAHVLLIEGTMEPVTKYALSALIALAVARLGLRPGLLWRRPAAPATKA